jgi:hypothetical protein
MKEHDMVVLTKQIGDYPAGTIGCIVSVHSERNFVVEVKSDTIDADDSNIALT